ncbi:MAG: serine/threonine-protein kinase [Polyangiaceae bacterium]
MSHASSSFLRPGARVDGRYEIVSLIGRGGSGAVYRARHVVLDSEVAIKVIPTNASDAPARASFAAEMQVMSRIDHPHVVRLLDGGFIEGAVFIVMELLRGEPLRARLGSGRALDVVVACTLLSQVAEGLAALHAARVLHRDIKPENVVVSPDGTAKIVDFGLARVRTAATYATNAPRAVGTLLYMSREQVMHQPLDESVDVFALGLMLEECLTGTHARSSARSVEDAIAAIVRGDPLPRLGARRPDLPRELLDLADRCVAVDPRRRPPARTCADVLTAFAVCARGEDPTERAPKPNFTSAPIPAVETPRRRARGPRAYTSARHSLRVVALLLGVAGVIAAILVLPSVMESSTRPARTAIPGRRGAMPVPHARAPEPGVASAYPRPSSSVPSGAPSAESSASPSAGASASVAPPQPRRPVQRPPAGILNPW